MDDNTAGVLTVFALVGIPALCITAWAITDRVLDHKEKRPPTQR